MIWSNVRAWFWLTGDEGVGGPAVSLRYTHHVAPFCGVAAQTAINIPMGGDSGLGLEGSVAIVLQLEDH